MSTKHDWSIPIGVYEGISGVECRNCGARVLTSEIQPTAEELAYIKLPEDCDQAVVTVIHEGYPAFEKSDCWNEDDWPPKWETPNDAA